MMNVTKNNIISSFLHENVKYFIIPSNTYSMAIQAPNLQYLLNYWFATYPIKNVFARKNVTFIYVDSTHSFK